MTNRYGGTRLRLLIGASAAVLVAVACGGSVTPTASPASQAPSTASSSPGDSTPPSAATG